MEDSDSEDIIYSMQSATKSSVSKVSGNLNSLDSFTFNEDIK